MRKRIAPPSILEGGEEMGEEQFEDFIKHWQAMFQNICKIAGGVRAINDAFTKKRPQDIKGKDSWLALMRKRMEEYERNIRHTMETVRVSGNDFANDMEKKNLLPEATCKDIRECAVKVSEWMKPILELLSEVQVRWEK